MGEDSGKWDSFALVGNDAQGTTICSESWKPRKDAVIRGRSDTTTELVSHVIQKAGDRIQVNRTARTVLEQLEHAKYQTHALGQREALPGGRLGGRVIGAKNHMHGHVTHGQQLLLRLNNRATCASSSHVAMKCCGLESAGNQSNMLRSSGAENVARKKHWRPSGSRTNPPSPAEEASAQASAYAAHGNSGQRKAERKLSPAAVMEATCDKPPARASDGGRSDLAGLAT